jgi:hypothetical protein
VIFFTFPSQRRKHVIPVSRRSKLSFGRGISSVNGSLYRLPACVLTDTGPAPEMNYQNRLKQVKTAASKYDPSGLAPQTSSHQAPSSSYSRWPHKGASITVLCWECSDFRSLSWMLVKMLHLTTAVRYEVYLALASAGRRC